MSDDEQKLVDSIANCKKLCAENIKRARFSIRMRYFAGVVPSSLYLIVASIQLYALDYWNGVISSLMALAFAAFNWWCWSISLKSARRWKKEFAALALSGETILAEYRGYIYGKDHDAD